MLENRIRYNEFSKLPHQENRKKRKFNCKLSKRKDQSKKRKSKEKKKREQM